MSANQSNLSNSHYGYDFVVATTQESINATMKRYLYNTKFPLVKMYWNQDDDGNPVPISYEELMKQTNNTDPLKVSNWKKPKKDAKSKPLPKDIENINNSNFYFAFEARIGIPANVLPANIPDIITLETLSQSVNFSLLCADFTIVTCNFGRHGLISFNSFKQADNTPWLFTSTVPLKQITDNTNLPKEVKQQLDNYGPDAFSVQQLIFDLDQAALQSIPTIGGVKPGTPVSDALTQVFTGAYFSAMKTSKQPVLNYAIVENNPSEDKSTLRLTNMKMEVSPYKDPKTKLKNNNLNTLNYLCEVNGGNIPPAVVFKWNWLSASEAAKASGVIAINRDIFLNYFKNQLTSHVTQNCYKTWVNVSTSGFLGSKINYKFKFTENQAPTITIPQTGAEVLKYHYKSATGDEAGLDGDMGAMNLLSTTDASVTFKNNTIIIAQSLLVNVYVRSLQNSQHWNAIKKTITDTYTLSIGQNGALNAKLTSTTNDQSDPAPHKGGFINAFTDLNKLVNSIEKAIKTFVGTDFTDIPLNVAQKFVFPGGKTFTFKDVEFSDHQDLISRITYV